MPSAVELEEDIDIQEKAGFEVVPISWLTRNPQNPRGIVTKEDVADLVESIRERGILQPLLVCPTGEIIAGERRFIAAELAGLKEIPVIYRDVDSADESRELALIENIQRKNLSPSQEARVYRQMKSRGMSTVYIAKRIGFSPGYVNKILALLDLPVSLQEAINDGRLSMTSGFHLAQIKDQGKINAIVAAVKDGPITMAGVRNITEAKESIEKPQPQSRNNFRLTRADRGSIAIDKAVEALDAVLKITQNDEHYSQFQKDVERLCEEACALANAIFDSEAARKLAATEAA